MIYSCCNQNRKSAVLKNPTLNGIDYLEVLDDDAIALDSPRQQTLLVHCLKTVTLPDAQPPNYVFIEGGESITGITVDWAAPAIPPPAQANPKEQKYFKALADAANVLVVRTNRAGDFSTYTLRLVNDVAAAQQDPFDVTAALTGFDPQLAEVKFSFKVECGPDFDCAPPPVICSPAGPTPPPINYLAKDYGSFRQIMLDRLNQLLPAWGGSATEADLGVALTELIAYVGDQLSYQQDAVATEAYLETARSRVSLRRHALLVDYHVHDGCNARAWLQTQVAGNPGEQVFLDRKLTRFYTYAPGMPSSLAVGAGNEEAALLRGVQIFEPMWDTVLYPELNQMSFYTWGDTNCCLPQGATEATLAGSLANLQPGDVLIFQEMKGPQTGIPTDADIRHRCAVRLTQVATLVDPLFRDAAGNPIPVTEIQWSQSDALPFPVCISAEHLDSSGDRQTVTEVSVAFGNIVAADHGVSFSGIDFGTMPGPQLFFPPDLAAGPCQVSPRAPLPVRFRPLVPDSPLTQAVPLAVATLPVVSIPVTAGVRLLGGTGPLSLADAAGFACLTLQATNPAGWPQYFGVVASSGSSATSFNLAVIYSPPGGAAGIQQQVRVEKFTNLTLAPADPNYAVTQINAKSKLIQVPSTYTPGTVPASFPAAPTMLPKMGAVDLYGSVSPTVAYLTLEAASPVTWPSYFGVLTKPGASASSFDLQMLYNPPSGVGVAVPVLVEEFPGLTLATAADDVNGSSEFITVESFAQTADASLAAYDLMNFDPSQAVPAIGLTGTLDGVSQTWTPKLDLLESTESAPDFVVEVDTDGTATLRFGDTVNGKTPDTGTSFVAHYRIGNGTAGNVGADSLVYLAAADARIQTCRNPLPATGGTDPETNDQIRRRAPEAFLTQERAVTMADYEAVAAKNPQVDRSVASLRWTGSWYTVFIAVEPQGGGLLTPTLQGTLKAAEERYRLAGQDLELDSPQYVSLEIELQICVDPNYFMSYVEQSLLQVLSNRILPNGQKGLFYADNFSFGQTVYLSPVYAAVRSVAGVVAVTATTFQPQGVNSTQYLAAGEIKVGPLQVARLDNDPNYPDHGQLTLLLEGGK
jgi:hypothetical protein